MHVFCPRGKPSAPADEHTGWVSSIRKTMMTTVGIRGSEPVIVRGSRGCGHRHEHGSPRKRKKSGFATAAVSTAAKADT